MKKLPLILAIQLLAIGYANAQFFSGKYHSTPAIFEFDHLKVHHHHNSEDKYHGDLQVKAYTDKFELWESSAVMIHGEKADFFIRKFGKGRDIKTVYEFKIALDGIEEDYILLGYEDEKGHGSFLVVEEVFKDISEEDLLSIKTFELSKSH